jgi:hypothetical protein
MLPTQRRLTAEWADTNDGWTFTDHIKAKHAGVSVHDFYEQLYAASGSSTE